MRPCAQYQEAWRSGRRNASLLLAVHSSTGLGRLRSLTSFTSWIPGLSRQTRSTVSSCSARHLTLAGTVLPWPCGGQGVELNSRDNASDTLVWRCQYEERPAPGFTKEIGYSTKGSGRTARQALAKSQINLTAAQAPRR